MTEEQIAIQRKGREGGRWINERPTSEDFAVWFRESMKLDPMLKHEDYIGGVVLIPAVDTKAKYVTGFDQSGMPVIDEREELSYIPYAKVETRVAYFWDLIDAHSEEWIAVVEHVSAARLPPDPMLSAIEAIAAAEGSPAREIKQFRPVSALAQMVHQLPVGFSIMSVPVGDRYAHFLNCTIRVSIYNKEDWAKHDELAVPLRTGRGTKQVPLLAGRSNPYADPSSLMKAETGALGRALGFAGIFVIPGSGVATAEDMLEAMAQGQTPAEAEPATPTDGQGPTAPEERPVRTGAEATADEESALAERAKALFKALKDNHPEDAEKFAKWAHDERGLNSLSAARGATLRGVVKKLEKITDEAERRAQQAAPEGDGDAPETATTDTGEREEATGDGDEPSGQAG